MADDEAATIEERLKSSLWYAVGQFVDEECLQHDLNATPQFIGALTELVYTQIANTAKDLETFSKHAGRKIINTDDVMLLTRRNEGLESLLQQTLDEIKAKDGRPVGNKGRIGGTSGAAKNKGKGKAKA